MDRLGFIKSCTGLCLGGIAISVLAESCSTVRNVNADLVETNIVLPLSEFKDKNGYRRYVLVYNPQLKYPICVYRNAEDSYKALWMQCPHQGAELQVFGEKLQCPAHGSEFDTNGIVQSLPASSNLRSFPITIETDKLLISLK